MALYLQHNYDLTTLNTLRLTAQAAAYTQLSNSNELKELSLLIQRYSKFLILGSGSNLLLPEIYNGLVIKNMLQGIYINEENQQHKTITAMAGENWDSFVAWCCNHHAYGLENLSLIPGTVGASPIQNIGAYGVEVKDFIDYVSVYDLSTNTQLKLTNSDCQFSYRNSMLKHNRRYIVISVTFKLLVKPQLNTSYGDIAKQLALTPAPTPQQLRECIIKIRQAKLPDPAILANAGSFFHNPIITTVAAESLVSQYPKLPVYATLNPNFTKISAGWLIDNLGLKGYQYANLGIYSKQALVLVNYQPATQTDILNFAKLIQNQVKQQYAINLNIEPIIPD